MSLSKKKLKKRVLVVDDSSETANTTRFLLEKGDFEVSVAGTISFAQEELKKEAPNVLLLDLNLPDGDGLDFLDKFKKLHPEVPVIIFTSEGYNEEKMEIAQKRGASGYVSKFVGPLAVIAAIRNALITHEEEKTEGELGNK